MMIVLGLESRCGYVILLMAVYWVTEALPLPITALLPGMWTLNNNCTKDQLLLQLLELAASPLPPC